MSVLNLKDNTELYYEEFGENAQPTVIMIHGFSGRHTEFKGQIIPFVEAGYHVVQVDLRNHGRSTYDPGASIARLSADIHELIIKLNKDNVTFMAHSMGAAVVWSYCQLFGTENIRAIITIDESPQCLATTGWPYSLFDTTWATLPDVMLHFKETKMTVTRLPDETFTAIKAEQATYPFDVPGNQALLMNHVSLKWQHIIEQIDVPQLYVAGGQSPLWSSEHATYCAQLNTLGQAVIIPDTGHMPHAEKPGMVNMAAFSFLNANK